MTEGELNNILADVMLKEVKSTGVYFIINKTKLEAVKITHYLTEHGYDADMEIRSNGKWTVEVRFKKGA